MNVRRLEFSQCDATWKNGSTACCPISLMLCLYTSDRNKYSSAFELFSDTKVFRRAVKYGNLLWRMGVTIERANSIAHKILKSSSTRSGKPVIDTDADYMYPIIEEVILRSLYKIIHADAGKRDNTEREWIMSDIDVCMPGVDLDVCVYQDVSTLVKNTIVLKDIIGIDNQHDFVGYSTDLQHAHLSRKHSLIVNILSACPKHTKGINELSEDLTLFTFANRELNVDDIENRLIKNAHSDVWYLYCLDNETLMQMDKMLSLDNETFRKTVFKEPLELCKKSGMIRGTLYKRLSDLANVTCDDFFIVSEALNLIVSDSINIPTPTLDQLKTRRLAILMHVRGQLEENCATHTSLLVNPCGHVSPLHTDDIFKVPGQYVITGTTESSISVIAMQNKDQLEYVLYDSHIAAHGGSTVKFIRSLNDLSAAIHQSLHTCTGTIYRLRIRDNTNATLKRRYEKLWNFFRLFRPSANKKITLAKNKQEKEEEKEEQEFIIEEDVTDSDDFNFDLLQI